MLVTVFTPTYNRAYCLHQLYDSLCGQTSTEFEWLIIDDGSSDNTKQLVEKWKIENKIIINYAYKENGGMHTAHNKAYELIKTEWNVCVDSDDFMPVNAIDLILKEIINLPKHFAGLLGLDEDKNTGNIIGTKIPESLKQVKLNELYSLHSVKGDKKLVLKTDVIKKYPPYPVFEGEKFVPLDYKYLLIDQDYFLKPVNKVFCIVEYQIDGSTRNILNQYRRNPRGFAFSRLSRIKYGKTFIERYKNAIHLVSSVLFIKDFSVFKELNYKGLVFLAFPLGILLNLYIRIKTKN